MANYLRVYFVREDELASSPAPEGHIENSLLGGLKRLITRQPAGFPEWADGRVRRARREDDPFYEDEVLEQMHIMEPAIEHIVDIRTTWAPIDDLEKLSEGLEEPYKSRWKSEPDPDGANFAPEISPSSPTRSLDLPGFCFFTREEVEALKRAYDSRGEDDEVLILEEDGLEYSEWRQLFEAHASEDYDLALFAWEV